MKYGYARISSYSQKLDRQIKVLTDVGCDTVITDRESGKNFDRKGYKRLIRKLRKGDELYIKSIDRLGRNYEEIIEQWRTITVVKGVNIIVLDFPLLNTKEQVNGLTGRFLSELILQILSYVAQIERENIKQRQKEGIEIAKAKGTQFGRQSFEISAEAKMIVEQYMAGEISSLRKCGQMIGVSHVTVAKWVKQLAGDGKSGKITELD
ncbi:recombinase family protein [Streptococcus suis]|uniref:recombinase family protein n=1 Tax=Streptococcus suis TaxID=1307 RepID=UPI001ABDE5DC|nr:recombinase family protein [Streptococcus suis]MBO4108883.1 recombinase family protein [Streptococcus suis]